MLTEQFIKSVTFLLEDIIGFSSLIDLTDDSHDWLFEQVPANGDAQCGRSWSHGRYNCPNSGIHIFAKAFRPIHDDPCSF